MAISKFENVKERNAATTDAETKVISPDGARTYEPESLDGASHGSVTGDTVAPGSSRSTRGRFPKWLPFAAIGALLVLGVLFKMRSGGGAAPASGGGPGGGGKRGDDIPAVKVVPVSVGNITQILATTGNLKSNQNIDLSSKISGRVARVLVEEGTRVRRGQLLVQLDDADLRAQVALARANVSSAQVRLRQTIVGLPAREQQVVTSIQQAQANFQTAQARYQQALLNEPAAIQGAQGAVQSARSGVRTAEARLRQARETARETSLSSISDIRRAQSNVASARAALADVQRGARDQQIAQAQSTVNVAQANLNDAQTELNRQRQLFEGGAAARAAVDAAQTRFDITRAQLESAQQNLSLVREGATTEQVRQSQEAVRQAELLLAQAQTARTTRVPIAQNDVISAQSALSQAQETLQTAQSNLAQVPITRQETRVAREAVEQARASLSQARANRSQIPVAREDVNAARSGVEQAQAALQTAQVNLGYARILSPVNGVVNTKLTGAGETAGPGVALLNLVSLDRVYFEAQVSENSVSRIRVGQPATISVTTLGDASLRGYVSDIIPTADARLRQFRVRISIPDAPRELTPGAFARGTIATQTVTNALVVPENAVQQSNGKSQVLVAVGPPENAVVKRRTILTGISAGGRVQVLGGVQKGDRIIFGDESLEDSDKVRIAKG